MKVLRVSKLCEQRGKGLIDSGATHPLRMRYPKERIEHYAEVKVVLAGGREVKMKLSPQGILVSELEVEPIVPMGVLTRSLECKIHWDEGGLRIDHPGMGQLQVTLEDGCPMIDEEQAMKLIRELEGKAKKTLRTMEVKEDEEVAWIRRLVHEHPIFKDIPEDLRQALIRTPSTKANQIGNRRTRKLDRKSVV